MIARALGGAVDHGTAAAFRLLRHAFENAPRFGLALAVLVVGHIQDCQPFAVRFYRLKPGDSQ